jgi:ribonucleoside-diphosphate reductase alpha chain
MNASNMFHEEEKLRNLSRGARSDRPRYQWESVVSETRSPVPPGSVKVLVRGQEADFDLGEVANTIGSALTNLMVARERSIHEIFSPQNQKLVEQLAVAVAMEVNAGRPEGQHLITSHQMHDLIQRVLAKTHNHDIARSMVQTSSRKLVETDESSLLAPSAVITRVIRRNGQVVPWNQKKVENAARRAFLSLELDSAPAAAVAEAIGEKLLTEHRQHISVEDLQDMVEEELMVQRHYKVARAYIQYRNMRSHLREQHQADVRTKTGHDEGQATMISVKQPNGEDVLWSGADLKKRIEFASLGLELNISPGEIEAELRRSTHDGITEKALRDVIILNTRTLIQKDADFAKFAGRVLLSYIYEETLGWDILRDGIEQLAAFHRRSFRRHLMREVEIDRIHPDMLKHDLDRLADALDPVADLDFEFLGVQTMYDRYLIVDKQVKPERRLETPQLFWMRVSMGLFMRELRAGDATVTDQVIALYRMYKSRRFCSSTPTLFNSGTLRSQLSSCYLYKVEDSIESIMQRGIAENAYLSKWAGGLGGSWTAVRGTGGMIKGTNGESQGVIPFLKLHNDQLIAVNQGGKRRGSGCAYLEIWHNDIEDFLQLRINTGDDRRRTHDLNTANWIPDLFMQRFESRRDWTLFRSNDVADLHDLYGRAFTQRYEEYEALAAEGKLWSKKIPAVELWKKMLKAIYETGHPWLTFKDPCNVRSPQDHAGVIHSSNLCTEITLNTGEDETAVCNLGSILIENHLTEDGSIDHTKLRETIRTAVRVLDNVIDINYYPTQAAKNANSRHRPIGLGVMGMAYALYKKDLSFSSKEAIEFNDEIMEAVAYYAYEASSDLAAERGKYQSYEGSKWSRGLLPQDTIDLLEAERGEPVDVPRDGWMDWKPLREKISKQGMRNSNVLAIAPTATISNIMGSSPCIEPMFSNLIAKSNLSGDFTVLNGYLVRDLKKRGLWTPEMLGTLKYTDGELSSIEEVPEDLKRKYATAFGIDATAIIEAAARRQKWIDQSQSVNLWFAGTEMSALSLMYRSAWRKGLKTTYYLRTLSASKVEKVDSQVEKVLTGVVGSTVAPKRTYTEEEILACRKNAETGEVECEACQ